MIIKFRSQQYNGMKRGLKLVIKLLSEEINCYHFA